MADPAKTALDLAAEGHAEKTGCPGRVFGLNGLEVVCYRCGKVIADLAPPLAQAPGEEQP